MLLRKVQLHEISPQPGLVHAEAARSLLIVTLKPATCPHPRLHPALQCALHCLPSAAPQLCQDCRGPSLWCASTGSCGLDRAASVLPWQQSEREAASPHPGPAQRCGALARCMLHCSLTSLPHSVTIKSLGPPCPNACCTASLLAWLQSACGGPHRSPCPSTSALPLRHSQWPGLANPPRRGTAPRPASRRWRPARPALCSG